MALPALAAILGPALAKIGIGGAAAGAAAPAAITAGSAAVPAATALGGGITAGSAAAPAAAGMGAAAGAKDMGLLGDKVEGLKSGMMNKMSDVLSTTMGDLPSDYFDSDAEHARIKSIQDATQKAFEAYRPKGGLFGGYE